MRHVDNEARDVRSRSWGWGGWLRCLLRIILGVCDPPEGIEYIKHAHMAVEVSLVAARRSEEIPVVCINRPCPDRHISSRCGDGSLVPPCKEVHGIEVSGVKPSL